MNRPISTSPAVLAATVVIAAVAGLRSAQSALPVAPLAMRAFTLRFDPAGTFSLEGPGWPSMSGTWTTSGNVVPGETITLLCSSACTDPARCHRTLLAGLVAARSSRATR